MNEQSGEITRLLKGFSAGDRSVDDDLFRLLYRELHTLAKHYLWGERRNHTLQPTALINEVFLKLIGQRDKEWVNRSHFVAVCAQVMRRVLVDSARRRRASKRTVDDPETPFRDLLANTVDPETVLDLDRVLSQLAALDERQGRIVELRYFAGLSEEETAELLEISPRTVRREWALAKAWLLGALRSGRRCAVVPNSACEPEPDTR